jgi:cyclopropane-fatty-acyl-phospholipid synthase
MVTQQATTDAAVQTSQKFLQSLAAGYHPRDFAVRFWDGSTWEPEAGQSAQFSIVLQHPGALRKMFWPPDGTAFAEAYAYDDFDIEGDIYAFFRFIAYLIAQKRTLWEKLRRGMALLSLPSQGRPRDHGHQPIQLKGAKHSLERDRQVIGYHYDLSNDFFSLWLDKDLLYTCAYFLNPDEELETAQTRKMDYICRKLRLRPGERLLDIGCGWGAFIQHAAQHYGVEAIGVTLSQRQVELANERIRKAGLADRCRVEYRDYREINDPKGFDKIACIGMLEHLGESMMPIFFQGAWNLLRPGGVFLNHGLTLRGNTPYPRWTTFARKYVFPDGELRPVNVTLRSAEDVGFEVRDVESLRDHYAITLGHWVSRLEARREEVVKATSDVTYRIFRLYLAGARQGMKNGVYNIHQSLLAKPREGEAGLPLTRADWYQEKNS